MGLMDRVKAQVDSLAQQANAGVAKLDNLPVQRRSDSLLRSLGIAVLAQRTGRGNPRTSAEIDRLISEITEHERLNNIDVVRQASAWATGQGSSPMGPPGPGQMAPGPGPMAPGPMGLGPRPDFPSPPPANQNVAGSMPGAGAGYGGYGAPGAPGPGGPPPGAPGAGGPPRPGAQAQPFAPPPSFPPPQPYPPEQALPPEPSFPRAAAGPTGLPSASPAEPVTQPAPLQDAAQQDEPEQERPESSA